MTPPTAVPAVPAVPAVVGVAGGGRMGVGIAHAFVLAGASVVVLERDADAAARAARALRSVIATSVERQVAAEPAQTLEARTLTTTDAAALAASALVIEAVPEDARMKTELLARVERELAPGAWLASNTSSLSIGELASCLERPERFCGLHFFNPVPASSLVEIVRGPATAPELIAAALGWVAAIGKTPITVRDSPGFASSRLGVVVALEAIRMLEDGVASAEDIDTAMVLGYKFPVGPLRLTDMVGLDVRLAIAEHLEAQLGSRFDVPALLRQKVAAGNLGRKSGEGFFSWGD